MQSKRSECLFFDKIDGLSATGDGSREFDQEIPPPSHAENLCAKWHVRRASKGEKAVIIVKGDETPLPLAGWLARFYLS